MVPLRSKRAVYHNSDPSSSMLGAADTEDGRSNARHGDGTTKIDDVSLISHRDDSGGSLRPAADCGVPLGEWIRTAHKGRRGGGESAFSPTWILEAVEIARGIAGGCRRARDSDFSVDSFVVMGKDEDEGGNHEDRAYGTVSELTVKMRESGLDDFPRPRAVPAAARIRRITESIRGNNRRRDNLLPLGAVLYEVFAGKCPFNDGMVSDTSKGDESPEDLTPSPYTPMKKRERRSPTALPCTPLREFGLPASLCDLVTSLLDSSPEDGSSGLHYSSFDEVEEDLCRIAADPDRFLSCAVSEVPVGRLEFPQGRLYGRDAHHSMMMEAYERVLESGEAREIVLLSGYSGMGKTCLVRHVQNQFVAKGAYFASGKFDKMCQPQPLSAIVAAFNEYCNTLLEINEDDISDIRELIEAAIGCDSKVLTDLIPNLSKVIGEHSTSSAVVGGKEAHNRLKFIFRKFVRVISTPRHPVVLFLDDLQWADETSLELVQFLVTDTESTSLLFVGTYRDNEVDSDHPLAAQLQNIKEAGVNITEIKVDIIDPESVNDLISDTLHLLPCLTRPLTDVVYSKTNGNPLFLSQFLHSLVDEGLLQFSMSSRRWKWDLDSIQSKAIADDVVELMMRKMLRLPQEVQNGLKVASCFGSICAESTLQLLEGIGGDAGRNIVKSLATAVSEGLMVKIQGTLYKFSHDQIQHAAYSLVPESDREALHLEIGRRIWKGEQDAEVVESLTFIAADQLNCAKKLITDHEEKIKLARLNLRAGKKAISSSSFLSASVYLLEGVQLLDFNDWDHQYELSLELLSTCAETLYVVGDLTAIHPTLEMIFTRGRCIQDKFRAYHTLMKSLGSQGRLFDAVHTGFDVLSELGERIPPEANLDVVQGDYLLTRDMLEGTTIDRILQRDEMGDKNKAAAMKFLSDMAMFAFVGKQELFQLIVFRMVRLTLTYGVCKESALGFANYGMVLCATVGDVRGGYHFGKLALSLLERFKAKECLPKAYCAVYGFINNYVEPAQASLVSLAFGYEAGMSTGDIAWAMTSALLYTSIALQCGIKLGSLVEEARVKTWQMKEYKQHTSLSLSLPYFQVIYNLVASSNNPTLLTGEAMDQEEYLSNAMALQNWHALSSLYFLRMWLAYLFGKYELSGEMAEKCLEISTAGTSSGQRIRGCIIVNETFYTGLVAVALARTEGQHKWRLRANNAMRQLVVWEQHSSWNFQHKVELLKAEIAFLDEDIENAAKAYDKSIQTAAEHGFIHEQALACERAGLFSLELGNKSTAKDYFTLSRELYLSWGAKQKADDVTKQLANGI